MKAEFIYRQGDVYIYKLSDFPDGDRTQDELTMKGQLALGELSGHNHAFDETADVDLFKINSETYKGLTFLDVKAPSTLTHGLIKGFKGKEADKDYHSEIVLKEGKYATGIVVETDWVTKTMRKVVD